VGAVAMGHVGVDVDVGVCRPHETVVWHFYCFDDKPIFAALINPA
jgi:hypothetical protein